nr:uncharacterized protein LOC111507391 [Leptinotarsa decemlineata]
MNAPLVADLREDMDLDCHFDMGTEELYAVKWYKDDHEFFRYMPRRKPNTMLFPVAGVHLASAGTDCSQTRCKIKLQNLSRAHSGGAYRCEISSEAPAFRLASETHNVTVAEMGLTEEDDFSKKIRVICQLPQSPISEYMSLSMVVYLQFLGQLNFV